MIAYKTEATLSENGKITLDSLPFSAGENVEVIFLAKESSSSLDNETEAYYRSLTDEEKQEEMVWANRAAENAKTVWGQK